MCIFCCLKLLSRLVYMYIYWLGVIFFASMLVPFAGCNICTCMYINVGRCKSYGCTYLYESVINVMVYSMFAHSMLCYHHCCLRLDTIQIIG